MARGCLSFILIILTVLGCGAPVKRQAAKVTAPVRAEKPLPPAPTAVMPFVRLSADEIPRFADDADLPSYVEAAEKSLRYYLRSSGNGPYQIADRVVTVRDLMEAISALREILRGGQPDEAKDEAIRRNFEVYRSRGADGQGAVLVTGYFEPIIKGSLVRTQQYRYPVYRTPPDAVVVNLARFGERYAGEQLVGRIKNGELIPYYSRREIEEFGVLAGKNLEIAWVDDRIALFFLHTQGSGKILLPDGRRLQIGYAMRNGRPFQSITRYLTETGRISPGEISYQAVKRYLRDNPSELSEIMAYNENFIFFREMAEGPVGSLGEVLTAGRSVATDAGAFPKGALAFLRTRLPVLDGAGNPLSWRPASRFVFSQDAGAAIKGAGRLDLFCGSGDEAEKIAGSLKEKGELYLILKKR